MAYQIEEIVFFKDGKVIGQCSLPFASTEADRYNLALGIGVTDYDQYHFMINGVKRFDSIYAPINPFTFKSVCQEYYDKNKIPITMLHKHAK